MARVVLFGIVAHRLGPVGAKHLDQCLRIIFDEQLDVRFGHLEMKLKAKETILKSEGLVFTQPAGSEQRAASRRRRRWRRRRSCRCGEPGNIKRKSMPVQKMDAVDH